MAKQNRLFALDFTDTLLAMLDFYKIKKTKINKNDENNLIQLCIDLYNANNNYQNIFIQCRNEITRILKKYNYNPKTPSKASTPNAMQNLPYLIKVLIYVMAYRAFELYESSSNKSNLTEPFQWGILDFIAGNGGYKLSLNTFTKLRVPPRQFYKMLNYEQINLTMSYAGAKKDALGYAINYLTAYAGTLDNFVDLFGGAAYASMAVMQNNNTHYYINDIDFLLVNYYKVLSNDSLYQMFITDINGIINALQNNTATGKWTYTHCENIIDNWRKKYPSSNIGTLSTQSANWNLYQLETNVNKSDAAVAFLYTQCFTVTGGTSAVGAVSLQKLKRYSNLNINELERLHSKMSRLKHIFNSDMLTTNVSLIELFSDKTQAMQFAHIINTAKMNLPKKGGNPRTLFYSDSPYLNTKGYNGSSITCQQMKTLIGKLVTASEKKSHFIFSCRASRHLTDTKQAQLTSCFPGILLQRKDGNIIFDSNRTYQDCRMYVYSKLTNLCVKKLFKEATNLLRANQEIYENVFKEFERLQKNLYVLACIEYKPDRDLTVKHKNDEKELYIARKRDLTNLLPTKLELLIYPIEVFITDFDFVCPPDCAYNKKNYHFVKYSISDFCKILDDHMFKSDKHFTLNSLGDGKYNILQI